MILFILASCSTSAPTVIETPAVTQPAPAPARAVLARSPLELREEIRAAGLDDALARRVPAAIPREMAEGNPDVAALKVGVLFARTLLGPEPEKAGRIERLAAMRAGLAYVDEDDEHLLMLDRVAEHVKDETAAWEEVLQQLDAEVKTLTPEAQAGGQTGPMLQAGAWLAGIHAVSGAVVESNSAEAAKALLNRGDVARWFSGYIQSDAGEAKMGPTAHAVSKALGELEVIFDRDPIGVDGAREVERITGQLLELAL